MGSDSEPDAIAVGGMNEFEPALRFRFHRAAFQAEQLLGFRAYENLVADHIPVPYDFAGAGHCKCTALHIVHEAVGGDTCESVLHDGEADQHHDQFQTA